MTKGGVRHTPFWASVNGRLTDKSPKDGGVPPSLCRGASRLPGTSLVLGQNQECLESCFETQTALDGQLAQVTTFSVPPVMAEPMTPSPALSR